jgi:hypothetical protein
LDRIDQPIGTDTNYQYRYTGKNEIVIYVVDTGIRKTHEEFIKDDGISRVRDECFTAFEGAGCHDDLLGHGTHVGMFNCICCVCMHSNVRSWLFLASCGYAI